MPFSQDQYLKTTEEKDCIRTVPFTSTMSNLMYVMLYMRLNICFTIGIMSRYQSTLGIEHWTMAKDILKYL